MKALIRRVKSMTSLSAGAARAATSTTQTREQQIEARRVAHEQRKLRKEGRLPPASARDVASRELLRGTWRPPIA